MALFPQYECREQEFMIRIVRGYEVVLVQENNKNIKERLTLINCQLLNLAKSAVFTQLIDYALYTAANLQCAINYNVLSLKKRKEYTDALFEMVTGHNHLLTLYKILGVTILLDPSVEMHTKTGTPTFSKMFPGTLEILETGLQPFSGKLSRLDDKNCVFLVNFLCTVGTKPVYTFIKKFVESLDDIVEE
ncbi:hypothetical protein ARMGADRAFT_1026062 [Armillaria gallica]|uniref:Uncharacterized protein n=1 Tax=Armillaria gallica TaxID=47427 RepID=A0A2H3DXN8_ARMGA|nr:hypothetical protein ARMGADRAFT_1026062 [Armillaria gallica]